MPRQASGRACGAAEEAHDFGIGHHRGVGVEVVLAPAAQDEAFGFEGGDIHGTAPNDSKFLSARGHAAGMRMARTLKAGP